MKPRGIIVIFSGPSGVGKGTMIEELLKIDDLNLIYSISTTTRQPRRGEENGRNYYFINKSEFKKRIKEGRLLEWAKFTSNYYGTEKKYVVDGINSGKNVLLEIETVGAMIVMKKLKLNEYISIFVKPPTLDELERRLKKRSTESAHTIDKRLKKAKKELKLASMYKYVITNDNLKRSIEEVKEIIMKETKN